MNCVIITAQEGLIDEMRMTLLALNVGKERKAIPGERRRIAMRRQREPRTSNR